MATKERKVHLASYRWPKRTVCDLGTPGLTRTEDPAAVTCRRCIVIGLKRAGPVPAEAAATNGEGDPVLDPTQVDLPGIESRAYDPKGQADRMITEWLQRQVDHYQGQLKELLTKDRQIRTQREQIIHGNLKAFSAAAIKAAGNALDRIAEGEQQDQDEARRVAADEARMARIGRDPFGGG